MRKIAVLIILVISATSAIAADLDSQCKSTAKGLKFLAQLRESGVPVSKARQFVVEAFVSDRAEVRNAWLDQLDNVYSGKLKGMDSEQVEMIMYNTCIGTIKLP